MQHLIIIGTVLFHTHIELVAKIHINGNHQAYNLISLDLATVVLCLEKEAHRVLELISVMIFLSVLYLSFRLKMNLANVAVILDRPPGDP